MVICGWLEALTFPLKGESRSIKVLPPKFKALFIFLSLISFDVAYAKPEWLAIGHAIGTGAKWPAVFRAQAAELGMELKLLHIKRGEFRPDLADSFNQNDFDDALEFSDSATLDEMVAALRPYNLQHPVVTGVEGISWPFALNESLGLPTLSQADAQTMLQKEKFYSLLRNPRFGVNPRALDFAQFDLSTDVLATIRKAKLGYPLAIKPTNAASGYGFSGKLSSDREVEAYLKHWRSQSHIDGRSLTSFVAQPYFEGDHYAIQAVVRDHRILVSDVFHHHKDGAVYLQSTLLSGEAKLLEEILESQKALLSAFPGFFTVHLELVKDPRFGYVPYDCGPRAMGGSEHLLVKKILGRNQMELFARSMLQTSFFDSTTGSVEHLGQPYRSVPYAALIDWRHSKSGRVVDVKSLADLQKAFQQWLT